VKTQELMMSNNMTTLLVFMAIIGQLLFMPIVIAAPSIEDLVNQDKLTISVKVNQNEQQIVGQAVVLSIEVATDRWFATGSQVQLPKLTDVVMQANNITTINGNKKIKGLTWATQVHEVVLYPTSDGDYQIPPIDIDISIKTESDGIVSGVLSTQEVSFNIQLPEELKDIENFIVSSEVTLSIDGQFNEEKDYAIGEAITQTITITAVDVPAMMITPLNLTPFKLGQDELGQDELGQSNVRNRDSKTKDSNKNKKDLKAKSTVDGVSIYHKPAHVFDKSNRGTLLGTRVESFTYIFEKPGSYTINEEVVYWWNSESSTLERLLIPSSTWTVSGGELISNVQASSIFTKLALNAKTLLGLVIFILLVCFAYLLFVKRQIISFVYKKITHYEKRQLRNQFLNHIAKKEYIKAEQSLFQYAVFINKNSVLQQSAFSRKLNQLAFGTDTHQNVVTDIPFSEAKRLTKQLETTSYNINKNVNFSADESIKLNN